MACSGAYSLREIMSIWSAPSRPSCGPGPREPYQDLEGTLPLAYRKLSSFPSILETINNRSRINDRRVVYGIKRVYGQVRASTPLPALRGKKQPLARSRAKFRRSISHFPGRERSPRLASGAPRGPIRLDPHPPGLRSRSLKKCSRNAPDPSDMRLAGHCPPPA